MPQDAATLSPATRRLPRGPRKASKCPPRQHLRRRHHRRLAAAGSTRSDQSDHHDQRRDARRDDPASRVAPSRSAAFRRGAAAGRAGPRRPRRRPAAARKQRKAPQAWGFSSPPPAAPGLEKVLQRLARTVRRSRTAACPRPPAATRGPVPPAVRALVSAYVCRTAARAESSSSSSPVSASSTVEQPGVGQDALARIVQMHADEVMPGVGHADFLDHIAPRLQTARARRRSCAENR